MKKERIIISTSFFLFTVISILVLTNNIDFLDTPIYNSLMNIRSNTLDTIMKTITILGNTTTVVIITIILIILLKKNDAFLFLITILSTVGANQILKHLVKRIRPDHLRLITEKGYSYPSGHAMISIALYGYLIYWTNQKIKNKYLKLIIISILTLIIIGIGCSRIYVGVHYPSDILGGYCLSLVILISMIEYDRGKKYDKNDSK